MKILLPSIYYPYVGGIAIHVENLCNELYKINSNYKFYILNYSSNNFREYEKEYLKIINVPHNKCRGLSYLINGYKIGKKIIDKENINIIHSHYAAPQGFLGAKLSKLKNIPNILTLHGSDVLKLSNNFIGKYFFNYALNNTDKIICVSNFLKNNLNEKYQNKSTVIYNGVDFNLFNTKNTKDGEYGLFVGSFVSQKGLEILVDAIKDINYNFKFIGNGVLFNKIKNKINNENIKNIELLGNKQRSEVIKYMKNCSFVLLPSLIEGFGLTLIEGMACGKPVIGTKVGGIPEIIKNNYNGFLVEPNNIEDLKLKIKFLIDETNGKDLRKELGINGEILSKNFKWENSAKEVDKIYNLLVG